MDKISAELYAALSKVNDIACDAAGNCRNAHYECMPIKTLLSEIHDNVAVAIHKLLYPFLEQYENKAALSQPSVEMDDLVELLNEATWDAGDPSINQAQAILARYHVIERAK